MILFIGVAGSGKSIQGKMLADKLGYLWLSVGQLLRMHVSGERRQDMLEGMLLNDDEVIRLLDETFKTMPDDNETVLDGFPRTTHQAEWLLEQADKGRFSITAVLHLKASEQAVRERLIRRGRPDDNSEAIQHRFQEYRNVSLPIIEFFRHSDIKVVDINGEQTIEAVHEEVLGVLNLK
jgi:adenylate kinase